MGSYLQRPRTAWRRCCIVLGVVLSILLVDSLSTAFAEGQPERRRVETLDPATARELERAYEHMLEERHDDALAVLTTLLQRRGERMKPFDLASTLQVRGQVLVSLERFADARRHFERAIQFDSLPPDQTTRLRFNVAQLYFQEEDYRQAVRNFERWLADVDEPSAAGYFMLAAAYQYEEDYAAARQPAEQAVRLTVGKGESPDRRHFDLLNIIYHHLGLHAGRLRILQYMVLQWPHEPRYWTQLAGLHLEQGEDREAFSALEIAYKSGLLSEQQHILTLVQFYAIFNNPDRGAAVLEAELQAENVERSRRNLELLAQLWSQAREHQRARPALEEAAELADGGELWYRLGQVLLSDADYVAAAGALERAVQRGGLTEDQEADAWLLLGTAQFNLAGAEDRETRQVADEAFARAEQFPPTKARASQWRHYIGALNETEARQVALERQQQEQLARTERERRITGCRAQRIAGIGLTEECKSLLADEES